MNYTLNNTFVNGALDMGKEKGAMQMFICKNADGGIETKGDLDKREVVRLLEDMISKEDALSLKWVPEAAFPKLKMPFKELLKKPNEVKGLATKIFNLFLKENNAKYGVGKFDMWCYPIEKAFMIHTSSLLKDLPDTFTLQDLINWFDMKGYNISNGPPSSFLKSASGVKTWLSFVKILLEYLFVVKGIDPDEWILSSPAPSVPRTPTRPTPSLAPSTSGSRLVDNR